MAELKQETLIIPTKEGEMPRRKSKFLKMLQNYTSNFQRLGNKEDWESPEIKLQKAKADLENLSM